MNVELDTMTLNEASRIVRSYAAALSREMDGRIARPESWLPSSKDEVRAAFLLFLKDRDVHTQCTKDELEQLILSAGFLNTFVPDKDAETINRAVLAYEARKQPLAPDEMAVYMQFSQEMVNRSLIEELRAIGAVLNERNENKPVQQPQPSDVSKRPVLSTTFGRLSCLQICVCSSAVILSHFASKPTLMWFAVANLLVNVVATCALWRRAASSLPASIPWLFAYAGTSLISVATDLVATFFLLSQRNPVQAQFS